jgi:hypothetical protein
MTVAAMAGLVPILWASGSEIMQRIAVPVIGGMVSSTALTLIVIPALFYLVHRRRVAAKHVILSSAGSMEHRTRGGEPCSPRFVRARTIALVSIVAPSSRLIAEFHERLQDRNWLFTQSPKCGGSRSHPERFDRDTARAAAYAHAGLQLGERCGRNDRSCRE